MKNLKKLLIQKARELDMDLCGVADAGRANEAAPAGFRPDDLLKGARSVVIIAQRMPTGSIQAKAVSGHDDVLFMRSFWNTGLILDTAAHTLSRFIEETSGAASVPVPTYSPLRIHGGEPRGIISLKHMAQLAGMGSLGKNSLLISKKHGNLLRLGGIITRAELAPDDPATDDPCPPGCTLCADICPAGAVRDRSVSINDCMKYSIRHPLMQPYAVTRFLMWLSKKSKGVHRMVEDMNNMLVTQYAEACTLCMTACPHYKRIAAVSERQ